MGAPALVGGVAQARRAADLNEGPAKGVRCNATFAKAAHRRPRSGTRVVANPTSLAPQRRGGLALTQPDLPWRPCCPSDDLTCESARTEGSSQRICRFRRQACGCAADTWSLGKWSTRWVELRRPRSWVLTSLPVALEVCTRPRGGWPLAACMSPWSPRQPQPVPRSWLKRFRRSFEQLCLAN